MFSLCPIYHWWRSAETGYCTAVPTMPFILIKGILVHLAAKLKSQKSSSATSFSPTQSLKPVDLKYEMTSPFLSSLIFMGLTPSPYHTTYPADVLHPHSPFYKRLSSESTSLELSPTLALTSYFSFISKKGMIITIPHTAPMKVTWVNDGVWETSLKTKLGSPEGELSPRHHLPQPP